jgi:hypothetical protein
MMRRFLIALCCFVTTACTKSESEVFYEIKSGEEFQLETISYRSEPYYWEWANWQKKPHVDLYSRVYTEKFIFSKMRNIGIETWSFRGKSVGVDTVKLRLRTYAEDSLNNLLILL